jgi:RHS repeat-associated protein
VEPIGEAHRRRQHRGGVPIRRKREADRQEVLHRRHALGDAALLLLQQLAGPGGANRHDADSSLVENRNRVLHVTLGRFVQRDPMGYVDGMGVYEYLNNNSPTFVDPAGLWKGKTHSLLTGQSFANAFPIISDDSRLCADTVLAWLKHWNLDQDKGDNFNDMKRHFNRTVKSYPSMKEVNAHTQEWITKFNNYLVFENRQFENALVHRQPTQVECEDALKSLGHLTHSWQDYYAHALTITGPATYNRAGISSLKTSKILWTGSPQITGSPDNPAGTGGAISPSSFSLSSFGGEHGINEVDEDYPAEGSARKADAIAFVATKYRPMLSSWAIKCLCHCNKIGKPGE